jgi:hypothetical protein
MIFEFEFSIPNFRVSNIRALNLEVSNPIGFKLKSLDLEFFRLGFETWSRRPEA